MAGRRHGPAADEAHLDLVETLSLRGAQLRVAVVAPGPDRRDLRGDLVVGGAVTDERAQIGAARREKTRVERAGGRQPRARAVCAERLRDRRDDADPPAAVLVAITVGDLTAVVLVDRLERHLAVDRGDDLLRRHDVVEAPAVAVTDVHELDEAERPTGALEVARHRQDAGLVPAAPGGPVDLDRPQADRLRGLDPGEGPCGPAVAV